MKTSEQIKSIAKQTLEIEAKAVADLVQNIDDVFVQAVELIHRSTGRVIVTGIGKSANIGHKIVATFNSTGTPSVFMHAADAIHGDLGTIQQNDIVLAISNSGNTPEIKVLLPLIKQMGNPLIALVGNRDSRLAHEATYALYADVEREACPHNLAPTTSTTAQLALGDALAICLLEKREFTETDFARYHPGGALGKRLYLRVSELSEQHAHPAVQRSSDLQSVIMEMTSNRLGATAVLNGNELVGVITDGDLRRLMQSQTDLTGITAAEIVSSNPKTIAHDALAIEAVAMMRNANISQVIVLNNGNYAGMVHFHDLLREGLI